MTTIYQALEHATRTLTHAGQTNARLEAQILLRHILHIERSVLYAYPERVLTPEQEQQFLSFIERRSRGEPIAYLTGHKEFYGLDFLIDKRVLIPRPETEFLVEAALHACHKCLMLAHTE
jgi:release factor glutamine methyltransferase